MTTPIGSDPGGIEAPTKDSKHCARIGPESLEFENDALNASGVRIIAGANFGSGLSGAFGVKCFLVPDHAPVAPPVAWLAETVVITVLGLIETGNGPDSPHSNPTNKNAKL
jgi:hypothetical protein